MTHHYEYRQSGPVYQDGPSRGAPKYGCFMFLLDVFMFAATGGLWIFWIIYRQFRNRRW